MYCLFSLSKNVNPTIQELINYSGVSRATINTLVDTGILAKKSKIINRVQSYETVQKVTNWSREIGYESISHDLVYGLPKQNKEAVEIRNAQK